MSGSSSQESRQDNPRGWKAASLVDLDARGNGIVVTSASLSMIIAVLSTVGTSSALLVLG